MSLKPSRGRITLGPQVSEGIFGLVSEFAICKSVRDTAILLDCLSSPAAGDPFVISQPLRSFSEEINAPVDSLTIGFTPNSWTGVKIKEESIRAVLEIVKVCENLGHEVEEFTLNIDKEQYDNNFNLIWCSDFANSCDWLARDMDREVSKDTLDPVNFQAYQKGKKIKASELLDAIATWNELRRKVGQLFVKYDLLITPTMNGSALYKKYASTNQNISFDECMLQDAESFPFTGLFNITGNPAISLPLITGKAGLPVGIQFVSRFGDEATLIRIASAFEQAMPWKNRVPPVHVKNI